MTSHPVNSSGRHAFPVASAPNLGSTQQKLAGFTKPGRYGIRSREGSNLHSAAGLRKHGSFNAVDVTSKSAANILNLRNVRSENSKRNLPKRTGSLGRVDWSRYSLDDDDDDNESSSLGSDVNNTTNVDPYVHLNVLNPRDLERMDRQEMTSRFVSDISAPDSDFTPQCSSSDKENSSPNNSNSAEFEGSRNSIDSNQESVDFENGCHSLPMAIHRRSYKGEHSHAHAGTQTKDAVSDRREHLKKRMRAFEVLPTFRKTLLDSVSQSSLDQSDDTLSETSGVHTLDFEDASTSFSRVRGECSESVDGRSVDSVSNTSCNNRNNLTTEPSSRNSLTEENHQSVDISTPSCISASSLPASSGTSKVKTKVSESGFKSARWSIKSKLLQFRRRSSEPVLRVSSVDTLTDPLSSSQTSEALNSPREQRTTVRQTGRSDNGSRDADRPLSAGTSGYSTDEFSGKVSVVLVHPLCFFICL